DDHGVGVGEAAAELVEEFVEARVAVRLHHGDHAALGHRAGGAQDRGDLDGVVAIVVDDPHAVRHADGGEATLHAAEPGQALADRPVGDAELAGYADGGDGVEHVVVAGHRQLQALEGDAAALKRRDQHV